ncbi:MAG: hypothetical protein MUO43_02110 [Desulfobacterales bacterium]|nr:hypothetical protein [Desulfobacterales bacterium]
MMKNDFQTNLKPVLQKIFVVLGEHDRGKLEKLGPTLSDLFSYMNITSHVYFIAEDLSSGMPQVEYIQKGIMRFLMENLFARYNVHFIHQTPLSTMKDIDFYYNYYYLPWKRSIHAIDLEGNVHRETPRLILQPVVVPDSRVDSTLINSLFDIFRSLFLLPALYLNKNTLFLTKDEALIQKVHKIYYGHDNSAETAEIVSTVCSQDMLTESSSNAASQTVLMTDPCPASLIISAQDGMVYSCMDTFFKKENLANIYEENVDNLIAQYSQRHKSNSNCLECRKQMVEWFSSLPLPQAKGV